MKNPYDDGGTEVLNPIIFCLKRAASINDGGKYANCGKGSARA